MNVICTLSSFCPCFSEWQLHFPLPQISFLLGARTMVSDSPWAHISHFAILPFKKKRVCFKNPREEQWLVQLGSCASILIQTPWPKEMRTVIDNRPGTTYSAGGRRVDFCAGTTCDVRCEELIENIRQVKFSWVSQLGLLLPPSAVRVLMFPLQPTPIQRPETLPFTLVAHSFSPLLIPLLKMHLLLETLLMGFSCSEMTGATQRK